MTAPVVAGAEPFAATGGDRGVLVLHGFTGSPRSMRPLAESLADRGYSVELPRLPGHGTMLDDLVPLRWSDWSEAAATSFDALAARCHGVAVVGLSMGGGLACWLAATHPETVALVAINPLVKPMADELREGAKGLLDAGVETIDGVANDIALEGADEYGYAGVPIAAALSLFDALEDVAASLPAITCPTLVFTSRQDHVVPTDNSELVAASVAGPVEQLWLEKSYHVATLDLDAGLIEAETGRFLDSSFDGR
jgi:carboxylesterase